jgi:hypothetical protein
MTTFRDMANQAVGGKHLGANGMTGVFKQQPARSVVTRKYPDVFIAYDAGHCGAHVALPGNTPSGCLVMSAGECGLSGVVCTECATMLELVADTDEPGLHVRG